MESSLKFTQEDWPGKKEALEEEERRETIDEKFDNIETALLTLLEKEKEKKKELEQDLARILSDTNQRMLKLGREKPEFVCGNEEDDGETTEEESSSEPKKDKISKQLLEDTEDLREVLKKTRELKELKRKIEAKKLDSSRKRKLEKILDEMGASKEQKMVVNWILQKGYAQTRMTEFVMSDIDHDLIKKP